MSKLALNQKMPALSKIILSRGYNLQGAIDDGLLSEED